jgi:hypothetical protein
MAMNYFDQLRNQVQAQGGVRDPDNSRSPAMATQSRQYGGGGFDFTGANTFLGGQQRRDTPFEVQNIKDAASGHGQGLQGAMGQLNSALQGNAARAGENRDRGLAFTNSVGAVPFDMDPKGATNWMADNARFQNSNFARQQDQAKQAGAFQRDQEAAAFPQQQQKNNALMDMVQRLIGMTGGGGGFGGFGGMPGSFNTNFGASGSF